MTCLGNRCEVELPMNCARARGTHLGVEVCRQLPRRSMRLKVQMLTASACGFCVVVLIGVASADDTKLSSPAVPEVELAPAVVVAAGADSIDFEAMAPLTTYGPLIQRGTVVQLDDGRIATVAHALIDARRASIGAAGEADPLALADEQGSGLVTVSRLQDLVTIDAAPLPSSFSVSSTPAVVGQQVALAGFPADGRLTSTTGTIIARTSGVDYGVGRPDVYVISAKVAPGWSGGPVVDGNGELIAIIVGIEQRSGVTLAVPVEHLP